MNTPQTVVKKVLSWIRGRGRGTVFTIGELAGVGSRAAIDQTLSRLARQGVIRRLGVGVYDYPRENIRLGGALTPPPEAIAKAVARRSASRLLPPGALAANALGLSTQVPTKLIYLTDGPQRTLRIGSQTLVFRHAAPRMMAVSGRISAMVFQALRYLGRDGVTPAAVKKLKAGITPADKQRIAKDIKYAVEWMRPVLRQIVATETK